MNASLSWLRSPSGRALLAKLVLGISVLVALASSPPPRWFAEQQGQAQLVFAAQNERRLSLSIELTGPLYADVDVASVQIIATADRTASDLELSVRPPEPSPDGSAPDATVTEAEADFRAGFAPDSDATTARADVRNPNVVSLSVPLGCVEADPAAPRADSCVEEFEITLARRSERPLSVDLEVLVHLIGRQQTAPEGTFEIHLEELAP